jgi:hypothetical protein
MGCGPGVVGRAVMGVVSLKRVPRLGSVRRPAIGAVVGVPFLSVLTPLPVTIVRPADQARQQLRSP